MNGGLHRGVAHQAAINPEPFAQNMPGRKCHGYSRSRHQNIYELACGGDLVDGNQFGLEAAQIGGAPAHFHAARFNALQIYLATQQKLQRMIVEQAQLVPQYQTTYLMGAGQTEYIPTGDHAPELL